MSTTTPARHPTPGWGRAAWLAAGAALAALVGADAAIVAAVRNGATTAFDQQVHTAAIDLRSPIADVVVTAFTHLGTIVPMLVIGTALTGLLFWRYRRWTVWVLMLITPIGSLTITETMKAAFARARPPFTEAVPPLESGFSFPSGHTLNSTAVSGMLAYLVCWLAQQAWQRYAAILAAAAWSTAIGASRVFLGHHWPSDVVFGWLAGLTWLLIVIIAHRLILTLRDPAPATAPTAATPP